MIAEHGQHDVELLSAFRDGVLGAPDCQRALLQLQACEECQELWHDWDSQAGAIKRLRLERAPIVLRQMTFEVTRRPDRRYRQSSWRSVGEGVALAAAGVAAVVVLGSVFQSRLNSVGDTAAGRIATPVPTVAALTSDPASTLGAFPTPGYRRPTPMPADTSWLPFGPRLGASGLSILGTDHNEIIGMLGDRIYRGRPGGANASAATIQVQSATGLTVKQIDAIVQSPTSTSVLFAASAGDFLKATDPGGLFRSTDGGRSWQLFKGGWSFSAVADPSSRLLVVGRQAAVLRSVDGGNTWQEINLREFGDYSITALLVTRQPGPVVYAGGSSEGGGGMLLRSTDGGMTWSKANWAGQLWVTDLASSADASVIYAAGGDGIFRSADGGFTWVRVKPPPGGTVGAIATDRLDAQVLYAGTRDGVFATDDSGASWIGVGALDGSVRTRRILVVPGDDGGSVMVATDRGLFAFPRAAVRVGKPPSD